MAKTLPAMKHVKFTEFDGFLFGEGTNYEVYKKLGAHPCTKNKKKGVYFAVWAPNAKNVSIITNANNFDESLGLMIKAKEC